MTTIRNRKIHEKWTEGMREREGAGKGEVALDDDRLFIGEARYTIATAWAVTNRFELFSNRS
jgi:hypothetical protein